MFVGVWCCGCEGNLVAYNKIPNIDCGIAYFEELALYIYVSFSNGHVSFLSVSPLCGENCTSVL